MDARQFFYDFGKLLYRIDGFYDDFAKDSGVKPNLLWILYALNDKKAHSQKEICETWMLPTSTVNTIIKELERDGYVELLKIKGEKRELCVRLTQSGQAYADKVLEKTYAMERKTFDSMPSECESTLEAMSKLDAALRNFRR